MPEYRFALIIATSALSHEAILDATDALGKPAARTLRFGDMRKAWRRTRVAPCSLGTSNDPFSLSKRKGQAAPFIDSFVDSSKSSDRKKPPGPFVGLHGSPAAKHRKNRSPAMPWTPGGNARAETSATIAIRERSKDEAGNVASHHYSSLGSSECSGRL